MAYEKTNWKARQGTGLNKFTKSAETATSVVLANTPDSVTDPGTPFSAANMNKIEEGIFQAHEGAAAEAAARQQGDETLAQAISSLTKSDVGLGSVTDDAQVKRSEMGEPNGVAALDGEGKVPLDQLPEFMSGEGDSEALARAKAYTDEKVGEEAEARREGDAVTLAEAKAYADRTGHPVGSYYAQYPVTGQSTIANMFPSSESPAVLFGGTWTEMYGGEQVFFKGGVTTIETNRGKTYSLQTLSWSGNGVSGIEEDAIREIYGYIKNTRSGTFSRVAESGALRPISNWVDGQAVAYGTNDVASTVEFNTKYATPISSRNIPRNRIIKVWKRTA